MGWAISGDWAVIAESDDVADDVVKATEKGSLADDEDFQHWTEEAGDAGVVTLYAGPEAGDYLAEHTEDMFGFPLGLVGGIGGTTYECNGDDPDPDHDGDPADEHCSMDSEVPDGFKEKLRDFKGMAATIRFDDGAIELEAAGDNTVTGTAFLLSLIHI